MITNLIELIKPFEQNRLTILHMLKLAVDAEMWATTDY